MAIINTWQSKQVIWGLAFANTVLAALKTVASGALIASAKLRLSNLSTFNPTPASTIAALAANECAYSGYTAGGIAVVLTTGLILSPACQGAVTTGVFEATTASPFVPDTAYGWWIDDGTNFICGEKFGTGTYAAFAAPGNFLDLAAFLPFQLTQATA
jgi:hypothetical protein